MNWTLHLILWGVIVAIIVAFFLYQRWLENHSDRYIHLHGDTRDAKFLEAQSAQAKRMDTVAKVKNALIIVLIVYVLAVAGIGVYMAWNNTGG
ncbi:MAG: hypothetical protein JOY62_12170 [Acidobacteriaceae bacterium]|nr:hypothetical protein [Acidobacteriaceae bacterium]MBV9780715.1 hypothetical protein [Acidobacteriaceae bacterium]